MNCRLLFNEEPITINRLAANVLGLNEAIVVQQIHYWLNINEKAKINIHDGHVWTYNTYDVWQKENFTFWSVKTVQRIFDKLVKLGIIIKSNYNKKKYDRTLWVTLDYDKLDALLVKYENSNEDKSKQNTENVEISTKGQNVQMSNSNIRTFCPNACGQIDQMDMDNVTTPIPETTKDYTETSISTTHEDAVVEEIDTPNTNKELIESNTHLIIDSSNKEYKIKKWKKDRLLKAIDIFKQQEGIYFSLLEKIYKDDKNFAIYELKTYDCDFNKAPRSNKTLNQKVHNFNGSAKHMKYSPEELEKMLLESNKKKFK
ncbi:hypothetical protein [Paraclostridium sordellii]|uniref:hypothetical protein n=1 Tax=Paraclostridium sordellii TaxID=1505 RepID=UPI0005DA75E8|nr:hypothetical protein [Paeniclostridium sordellii]CEO25095.1 conjugative transposon protein [[Clostridium] sordellii] [Paeniclostridium sordellii]